MKEIEKETIEINFWQNKDRALKITEELNELKKEVSPFTHLYDEINSASEFINLTGKNDENSFQEIENKIKEIENIYGKEKRRTLFSGKYDKGDAVITIFAGAGGDDAEDWTKILYEMYVKYAQIKNWNVETFHIHKNETGGIKNITFEVRGAYAYGYLKGESGVHRLVRVSPYSAKKLRHTSFAKVEVLPKFVETGEIEIKEEDLKYDFARSSGAGGQNVNKRETSVRVTHIPTNIQVHISTERSQSQNKEQAIEILRSKLYSLKIYEQKQEKNSLKDAAKNEWGYQIRSYVFHPYKMVKDLRTGVETSNVENVLNGYLDEFVEAENLRC